MKLIYTDTREEVAVGDIVKLDSGERVKVQYFAPPHKPASSGKIIVSEYPKGPSREYYVGVIGAEWINREDRT